jgi:hypothetical protein
MSHFKGHFEGAKTFLTPLIVPSAARDNLGVKKIEAGHWYFYAPECCCVLLLCVDVCCWVFLCVVVC